MKLEEFNVGPKPGIISELILNKSEVRPKMSEDPTSPLIVEPTDVV